MIMMIIISPTERTTGFGNTHCEVHLTSMDCEEMEVECTVECGVPLYK